MVVESLFSAGGVVGLDSIAVLADMRLAAGCWLPQGSATAGQEEMDAREGRNVFLLEKGHRKWWCVRWCLCGMESLLSASHRGTRRWGGAPLLKVTEVKVPVNPKQDPGWSARVV